MLARALAVTLGAVLLAACATEPTTERPAPTGMAAADGETVLLRAPDGTDDATLRSAADVVRVRLSRMGVQSTVEPRPDGVAVISHADAYQLRAAAQLKATTFAPVLEASLGPCDGSGTPSAGPATRCYRLGPQLAGVGAIRMPTVRAQAGAGWSVLFSVEQAGYSGLRSGLAGASTPTSAIVADGEVVLEIGAGVPALRSTIGPPLAEESARRAAAALAVDGDLPVPLEAPAPPAPSGARVGVDFWTAALGVHVCGSWLPNAPAFGLDTGVHSHGDGLVYVHPFDPAEAGDRATLGLLLQRGGWTASNDRLQLWDGVEHRAATSCPDGSAATVRWWIDGVEQHGDPATNIPRHGQVIVLAFDPDGPPPGPPPQLAALVPPPLVAARD
jgi:hypothetical protein